MCFLDRVIKTRFWEPSDNMLLKMFDLYTPSAEGLEVKSQIRVSITNLCCYCF